jgi:hypothetical protein
MSGSGFALNFNRAKNFGSSETIPQMLFLSVESLPSVLALHVKFTLAALRLFTFTGAAHPSFPFCEMHVKRNPFCVFVVPDFGQFVILSWAAWLAAVSTSIRRCFSDLIRANEGIFRLIVVIDFVY